VLEHLPDLLWGGAADRERRFRAHDDQLNREDSDAPTQSSDQPKWLHRPMPEFPASVDGVPFTVS